MVAGFYLIQGMKPRPSFLGRAALLCLLLATCGCRTYVANNRSAAGAWLRGDVSGAAAQYASTARRASSRDRVIWRLEEGAAWRAAGEFAKSNEALGEAEAEIDKHELRAKVSVSGEAMALLSNQAQLPYEGRIYDKVMMNTYRALNYLQLRDKPAARVEFNRVLRRQDDALNTKRRRLEREERALEAEKKSEPQVARMMNDAGVQRRLEGLHGFLDKYRSEANYRNPFAAYLRGLFFATHATGPADLEIARHDFRETAAMIGSSPVIDAELDRVEARFGGKSLAPRVHVIFETERAPARDQERIDLPLFIAGVDNLPYVGAAFPVLRLQYDYLSALNVTAGGDSTQTRLLADMDAIVGNEFADELPGVITKTLISSAGKAAISYTVNKAAGKKERGGDFGGFLAQLATTVYQAASNVADTRTWTTLPKQIQFAAVQMPSDRKVRLHGGNLNSEITLQPGNEILLYVKSISPHAPLLVTQTTLN